MTTPIDRPNRDAIIQANETAPAPEQPSKRRARKSAASAGPSLKPWREIIRPNADIVSGDYASPTAFALCWSTRSSAYSAMAAISSY